MKLQRLSTSQFERFSNFIYQQSGIRINEKKLTLLSNRIRRRLQAGDFPNFDAYYDFLTSKAGSGELEGFLDAVTTNETFFFRTPKHFDWLATDLLDVVTEEHRAGRREASLRIWSAACATGAEPYSIAIRLLENAFRLRDWSLRILATDISEEALREAREGAFRPRAIEAVTQKELRRFFQRDPEQDTWRVRPAVKKLVEFRHHNLMQPLADGSFDCIFLRNVLIYFDRESKRNVVNHLLQKLAVGGYLCVGPSEGTYDILADLHKISPLVYRKVQS